MRLPIPILVGLTAVRELIRAFAFPLHALLYLPRRRHWEQLGRQLLTQPPSESESSPLDRFLAGRSRRSGRHVFVSAGEISGETHAVHLMQAVRRSRPDLRWSCFGGDGMRAAGGDLLFPLSSFAIMGVMGVLRCMPFLCRALARYLRLLRDDPPDLVVLVDYPGLHTVMGRWARRHGVPVMHYIAPQYWAWAPWRLRRYRGCVDATLTILPFETRFFERFGLPAEYVGHPLLDHLAAHPIDPDELAAVRARPTLCMLPGSRTKEIHDHLPGYIEMARRLRPDFPDLRFVVVHVLPRRAELIRSILAEHQAEDLIELHIGELGPWLAGSRAIIAKSGTGSLEAALHGTPTVVVYKVPNAFWVWLSRTFVTTPWISLPNLVAGETIVPEHVFHDDADWQAPEASVRERLAGSQRDDTIAALDRMRRSLGEPGASARAARWIEAFFAP